MKDILDNYFDEYNLQETNELTSGSINTTYKIKINNTDYVLQKLGNIFNEDVIIDMINITEYLKKNKFIVPELISSKKNNKYIKINDDIFRIYKFIDGVIPNKLLMNENQFYDLGKYLNKFHNILSNFKYNPLHKIPNFHNTEMYIKKILSLTNKFNDNDKNNILEMITYYNNTNKDFLKLQQIIHGDTKIENIIYNELNNSYNLIDYDTIMLGSIYIDIGDMIRSFFINSELTQIFFDKNKILYFVKGYYENYKNITYNDFLKNCICITKIITLELSIRFFIDIIEDYYFGFNKDLFNNRKEQNIIRANKCFELFKLII